MQKLEALRNQLYLAIETGSKNDILTMSERLDKEILKYIDRSSECNNRQKKQKVGNGG
ncbi:MAG TPA: hypothetical protein VF941_18475 [Clostridia bacterium]